MKYPTVETERLFLRRPTGPDRSRALRAFGRGASVAATAPLAGQPGWAQMANILAGWEGTGHGLFAVQPWGAEAPVALVGPWQPAGWPEPEIGWLVWDAAALRDGLIAEAVAAARQVAGASLGWADAVSYVTVDDTVSDGVAAAAGAVVDPWTDLPAGRSATVWRHRLTPRKPRLAWAA